MRARGEDPDKIAMPVPDPIFAHVLVWYLELRAANSRGWRFEPISFSEIQAYRDLFGLKMSISDVDLLRRLDNVWQSVQPEPEKPKR